jgi:hypothetical protein
MHSMVKPASPATRRAFVISILVAMHLVATLLHGKAHTELAIVLPRAKNAFVIAVIVIAPVFAALLAWTRYAAIGIWIFTLSMFGALLFGIYHHYIMVSPDNIAHLPNGSPSAHSAFIASAGAVALLELVSATYGVLSLAPADLISSGK